jgi:hypothetical protein
MPPSLSILNYSRPGTPSSGCAFGLRNAAVGFRIAVNQQQDDQAWLIAEPPAIPVS